MKNKLLSVCKLGLLFAFISLMLVSCSDSDTEKKLNGTWVCEHTQFGDGVTIKMIETKTYRVSDHTMDCKMKVSLIEPYYLYMATVTYNGTWEASKEKVIATIDKNSVQFKFNDIIDAPERVEFKHDILDEFSNLNYTDGGRIKYLSANDLTLEDEIDGNVYKYTRTVQ